MNTNMLKMSYCSFSNAGETSNHDCNTSKKHLLINAKMREKVSDIEIGFMKI